MSKKVKIVQKDSTTIQKIITRLKTKAYIGDETERRFIEKDEIIAQKDAIILNLRKQIDSLEKIKIKVNEK